MFNCEEWLIDVEAVTSELLWGVAVFAVMLGGGLLRGIELRGVGWVVYVCSVVLVVRLAYRYYKVWRWGVAGGVSAAYYDVWEGQFEGEGGVYTSYYRGVWYSWHELEDRVSGVVVLRVLVMGL